MDETYNHPVESRWSTIINTPAPKLNVALDTACESDLTDEQWEAIKEKQIS